MQGFIEANEKSNNTPLSINNYEHILQQCKNSKIFIKHLLINLSVSYQRIRYSFSLFNLGFDLSVKESNNLK